MSQLVNSYTIMYMVLLQLVLLFYGITYGSIVLRYYIWFNSSTVLHMVLWFVYGSINNVYCSIVLLELVYSNS